MTPNSGPPIITFTPSAMPAELLEEIFVAREPLAKRILGSIKASVSSSAKHHWLVVGPRGIGKTHLVSVLYYRLLKDKRIRSRVRIAWLREESWEVASYADFLDAVLRTLATEYADDDLAAGHDALLDLRGREAEQAAEQLLLDFLGDRTLLLIAENVDDIFRGLATAGQRALRQFIENHDKVTVLATTTSLFSGVSNHTSPFYGFFTVHHLHELDLDSAKELLRRVATLRDDQPLLDFLGTPPADDRLRVVCEMAGGHPRIWVLFANCVSVDLIDELVPLFMKMLDDLTPYYQERLRALAPQQRRIVVHLATVGGAQPVREISRATRLEQRSVAKALGDLEEKGFVQQATGLPEDAVGDRRLSAYELREPLMRLALDIKESRGKPLRLIVAFLREWFGERLFEIARSVPPESLAGMYVREALRAFATERRRGLEEVRGVLALVAAYVGAIGAARGQPVEELAPAMPDPRSPEPDIQAWIIDCIQWGRKVATEDELQTALALTVVFMLDFDLLKMSLERVGLVFDHVTAKNFASAVETWARVWDDAAGRAADVEIPVRLMTTAVRWRRDHNRRHILALPREERSVFMTLLQMAARDSGRTEVAQ